MTLGQFPLNARTQVLDFFLVDKKIAVARDAELIAAEDLHTGEQFADELVQHGGQEDKTVFAITQIAGQADYPGQHTRSLDDRFVDHAAESIFPLQLNGKVKALVQQAREGMRRVQSDWSQDRHDFAEEIPFDPLELRLAPFAATQEFDPFCSELRQYLVVEQRILLLDNRMRSAADVLERRLRGQSVRSRGDGMELDLFFQPGHADLEELVEVAADNADITQALQ